MYNNQNILAVIPARGGSKGIPRKNIRILSGKPLIGWTIEEARKSKYIDKLILSSDDTKIIKIAKHFRCDVPFKRPAELSDDKASNIDVVLHAIKRFPGFDYVLLLQPTSPFRSVSDIDGCIRECIDNRAKACVSVYKPKVNPYWMYWVNKNNRLDVFVHGKKCYLRRQDLPKIYALNGAVYCAKIDWLIEKKTFLTRETLPFIMLEERSLDIDSVFDFKIAEALLKR